MRDKDNALNSRTQVTILGLLKWMTIFSVSVIAMFNRSLPSHYELICIGGLLLTGQIIWTFAYFSRNRRFANRVLVWSVVLLVLSAVAFVPFIPFLI